MTSGRGCIVGIFTHFTCKRTKTVYSVVGFYARVFKFSYSEKWSSEPLCVWYVFVNMCWVIIGGKFFRSDVTEWDKAEFNLFLDSLRVGGQKDRSRLRRRGEGGGPGEKRLKDPRRGRGNTRRNCLQQSAAGHERPRWWMRLSPCFVARRTMIPVTGAEYLFRMWRFLFVCNKFGPSNDGLYLNLWCSRYELDLSGPNGILSILYYIVTIPPKIWKSIYLLVILNIYSTVSFIFVLFQVPRFGIYF